MTWLPRWKSRRAEYGLGVGLLYWGVNELVFVPVVRRIVVDDGA